MGALALRTNTTVSNNAAVGKTTKRCISFKRCANTTGENNNGTSDVALGLFKQKKGAT